MKPRKVTFNARKLIDDLGGQAKVHEVTLCPRSTPYRCYSKNRLSLSLLEYIAGNLPAFGLKDLRLGDYIQEKGSAIRGGGKPRVGGA